MPEANIVDHRNSNRENRGQGVQDLIDRDIVEEVHRGMTHIIEAYTARAQDTPIPVAMANMVETEVFLPQEPKMRGTLVWPITPRTKIISVTVVVELIIGLAPAVYQRKL